MTPADSFLAIVDETVECGLAIRFAALRALHTGASVALLRVIRPSPFLQWGRAQELIDTEARVEAEQALAKAADATEAIMGRRPEVHMCKGKPTEAILEFIHTHGGIRALVLAAAAQGRPGPLVGHFAGEASGSLPCLVMIVPGGMSEADLDRLT